MSLYQKRSVIFRALGRAGCRRKNLANKFYAEVVTVCNHVHEAKDLKPTEHVCEECIKMGDRWVHLRLCLTCGNVGCCDSSKNRHATKHFHSTDHPVMRSIEPGETWGWCYVDEMEYDFSRGVKHAKPMG